MCVVLNNLEFSTLEMTYPELALTSLRNGVFSQNFTFPFLYCRVTFTDGELFFQMALPQLG